MRSNVGMEKLLRSLTALIVSSTAVLCTTACETITPTAYNSLDRPTAGIFLDDDYLQEGELEAGFQTILVSRTVTVDGIALLKTFEGEVRCANNENLHCPYNDSAQYCTIGHGHLIAKASCENISAKLVELEFSNGIDDEKATEILVEDLAKAQRIVEAHSEDGKIGTAEIDDYQYDALVSFIFNVGGENFSKSTLLKRLEDRKVVSGSPAVEFQFSRWIRSGGTVYQGLINRRKSEAEHFFANYGLPSDLDQNEGLLKVDESAYVDIRVGETQD
tara:strand:+ start:12075 stop:12899 length:825 start_codon:yes stop_codon:yes gene_type:complete